MKKISIHIYIVLAIFVVGFILGSFLDLQLTEAIFSEKNGFGLFMSTIGTMPGYGILSILGGALFSIALKKEGFTTPYRVIFYILAVAGFGISIYFSGREFFGENGFYGAAPKWVGYFIALPFMCGLAFLGYHLGLKSDNERLWLLIVVLMIAIFIALVPGVTALKSIFHRPRYRIVVNYGYEGFHHWWEPFREYKDLIRRVNELAGKEILTKEEFKSFPSGHGGASAVFMMFVVFLPLFNAKYQKLQLPLFYAGLAWTLLVCFTRILVGAHFLSDVSMGTILTVIMIIIAYYVVVRGKVGLPKEQPVEEN